MNCAACPSRMTSVVALRVGQLLGCEQLVRLDVCERHRLAIWILWPVRK